jgi:uncharacterized protein YkwD
MRAVMGFLGSALLVATGCLGNPLAGLGAQPTSAGTVDAACGDADGAGDPSASQAQIDGLWRLNCHRSLAGLPTVQLAPTLSQAAQAHADYMLATGEYAHREEDSSQPTWTGGTALERAAAAGYALNTGDSQLAEVIGFKTSGADATFAVDNWINTVYHREPLLVPQLLHVGAGEAGIYSVMELVAPWSDPTTKVALYPARGQSDVPVSFDSDTETPDPVQEAGLVGPPVTISVLSDGWASSSDPYDLVFDVSRTSIRATSGVEIPFVVLEPGDDPWLMRMVALVPLHPLDPGATYEVQAALTINGEQWEESWAFATRAEE